MQKTVAGEHDEGIGGTESGENEGAILASVLEESRKSYYEAEKWEEFNFDRDVLRPVLARSRAEVSEFETSAGASAME